MNDNPSNSSTLAPSWPADFPAACPPTEANNAAGVVFRYLRPDSSSPSAVDFRQTRYDVPHRDYAGLECQSCGVSVNSDKAESLALSAKFPKAFRNRKLAKGMLQPIFGKTLPTPSEVAGAHHLTWWIFAGIDPATSFAVTDEELL